LSKAVLFDLDGTLADTAPDLGAALNALRIENGHTALPIEQLRPHVSAGARGLIGAGFGIQPQSPDYSRLQQRFLALYEAALCVASHLFDGMADHLAELERHDIPWGIVTNKSQRFAVPLVEALGLRQRAACIVSGDSAPRPKPHVHPMSLASAIIGVAAADCIYVGDDERDIVAGRAAGMMTIAAAWGYLGDAKPPRDWGANAIASTPQDIFRLGVLAR